MAGFVDDVKVVLSNVFRRGRKGVDSLAEAIDQRSEIVRLNASMRKLNGERGERIVEIGKKVYALHKRGQVRNQDVLVECERIDEISGEISEVRRRIEELRMGDSEAAVSAEVEDETPIAEEEMVERAAAEMEAGDASEEEPADADLEQATGYELPDGTTLEPAADACAPADDASEDRQ